MPCASGGIAPVAAVALTEGARWDNMGSAPPTEPLAPEQVRWLHNLAESQELEAARQDELAVAAARRAAFMRQCAADVRRRFVSGVQLLPPRHLNVLLADRDAGLREAAIAALDAVTLPTPGDAREASGERR